MTDPRGHAARKQNTAPVVLGTPLRGLIAATALVGLLALAQPVQAQDSQCSVPDMNRQCTEFGTIAMESQRDIRGETIDMSASITLNTAYTDSGARWLLFSVRNVESDGSNPVTIKLVSFASTYGDIITTRVEQPSASELNLWVDTLDAPVGTPISIDLKVGSTERGAFKIETLVMAFDRGYAAMHDSQGNEASLFSFTLLGVNKETAAVSSNGGSLVSGHKLPGFAALPLFAVLVAAAVAVSRRRMA